VIEEDKPTCDDCIFAEPMPDYDAFRCRYFRKQIRYEAYKHESCKHFLDYCVAIDYLKIHIDEVKGSE
jgi:hypothetical protein